VVETTSLDERVAALLGSVPGVCRATDLPKRWVPSPGDTQEPAAGFAPCCVPDGLVDTQDLGDKRPNQEQPEGFVRA
jgi:hypothetical protein